ncbi:hypothetical protein [Paenibacillus dakarensis]|uniref:hypothetical protein n=1 Tax=Paenibacillus dakarensis TaxID=1527293 RepID=UPI0006D5AFD0|nr:hypothetical protein [Paenibacillus dakarensis]
MSRKLLLILCLMLFMLSACASKEETSSQNLGSEPPQPQLTTSDGKSIQVHQSSYCWSARCVDYIGPEDMLKDEAKDIVKANAEVTIQIEGKQPTELYLSTHNKDEINQEQITDNQFKAPSEEGIYYYSLSAFWLLDKDKRISEGSSSYVFAIEVKE